MTSTATASGSLSWSVAFFSQRNSSILSRRSLSSRLVMTKSVDSGSFSALLDQGFVRLGKSSPSKPQKYEISYFTSGRVDDVLGGRAEIVGREQCGAVIARYVEPKRKMPANVWTTPSHNAEVGGTN